MKHNLIERLHEGNYSCVIENSEGIIRTFVRRGVADLYDLFETDPTALKDSVVADKIVGKAVAALMILGGVKAVYADVISLPAQVLLRKAGLQVECGKEVSCIENRERTGSCPLESACMDLESATAIYPVIKRFVTRMKDIKM